MLKNGFFKIAIFYSIIIVFLFSLPLQAETITPATIEKPPDKISLDFTDANLTDVLRLLSQQAGISFVPTKEVMEAKVTMLMENVTVDDAINALMSANDLYFEKTGGGVSIVRKSGEPEIKTETKIYTLNYIQLGKEGAGKAAAGTETQSVIDTITKILTPNGQVVADSRTNSLIITDIPNRFDLISEIIARLDTPNLEVVIEVEMIETSAKLSENLGINWGSTMTLGYTGPQRQTPFPLGGYEPEGTAKTFTMGKITMPSLTATLNFLKSDTSTRFLARPKLMVMNNQTAEINITANQAVAVTLENITGSTGSTGQTAETIERMDIGTVLKVTPLINNVNMITLKIQPEVSQAQRSELTTSTGGRIFDKHIKKADTIVMLRDGETIVIGGIIKTEDTETDTRVPVLSELPLLGAWFKNKEKVREDRELLIFLTPHIIRPAERVDLNLAEPAVKTEKVEKAPAPEEKKEIAAEKKEEVKTEPIVAKPEKAIPSQPEKTKIIREQSAVTAVKPELPKPQPQKEKSFVREQ